MNEAEASHFDLHLLRHGAPEWAGRLLGRTDAAPTPAGIGACARQAHGLDIATLVSSDLARAQAAARAIAVERNLALTLDPRWRELDFGAWDGLAPADVDAAALSRFWDDPEWHAPPGGERWSDLVARVTAALDALSPSPTLIVCHAGAIRAALAALCGFSQPQTWAIDLPYAACLSLRIWPGEKRSAQITGLRR